MNADEFRKYGKEAIDFIADYIENIRDRPVLPSVEPGYLQDLLPDQVPDVGQPFEGFFKEMDKIIMPGVIIVSITHWLSPRFHAYYPVGSSYPSIIGEILDTGLSAIGFSWMSSPVVTELEVKMLDWLGKIIELPPAFLHCSGGPGGGIIQSTASETILVTLVCARERKLKQMKKENPTWSDDLTKSRMIAYSSDQSNSAVEKAGRIGSMTMRLLESDENCVFRGTTLKEEFEKDIADGLLPTYVCATLGTTGTCAFDRLDELGAVCQEYGVWLHVDAAYAGSAFVCPELRQPLEGVELADSFNFNLHKWLLVNFECSAFWVKNKQWLVDVLHVDRVYLTHGKQGVASAPDYRNWEIPLGRRFRSLKLWMVLRTYGVKGLQTHIRNQVQLAQQFESMLKTNPHLEVVHGAVMGLVCFKVKGAASITEELLDKLCARKNIYVVAGSAKGIFFIRVSICGRTTNYKDLEFTYKEISTVVADIVRSISKDAQIAKKQESISSVQSKISSLLLSLNSKISGEVSLAEEKFNISI